MPILSKPLIVPQFGNYNSEYTQAVPPFTVNLFGAAAATPPDLFAVDLTIISQTLGFGYPNFIPSPNVCVAVGLDLYVSISAVAGVTSGGMSYPPCAAILKFQGYFSGNNTTATAVASIFDASGNAYCGLAFDGATTLYAATTDPGSPLGTCYAIYAFPIAGGGGTAIYNDSDANASFGDLAFDGSGNLWAADYNNNRVMAFPAATLGATSAFTSVINGAGPFAVVNTDPSLMTASANVLLSCEGVGFDGAGNLWVGNNNDGYDAAGVPANALTSLVQITPGLQAAILGAASVAGGTITLTPAQALTLAQLKSAAPPSGFAIYQAPTPSEPYQPQFGGLQIDRISAADQSAGMPEYLYVNDEVYNTVRQFDVNPASSGFIAGLTASDNTALTLNDAENNPVVTNPGNGGIALVYASLLIGDSLDDTGVEPDGSIPLDSGNQPIFWESPNIGIGTSATAPAPPFTNYESIIIPVVGSDVYVYVNIKNIGCTPTTGSERLRVYWASGATTQSWPESWTEITTPPGVIVQTAGEQPLAPGDSAVVTIAWPAAAMPPTAGNTHYCLLARIETAPVYPFGMTYWENQTDGVANMSQNVVANSKIAQCNIYIGPMQKFTPPRGGRLFPLKLGVQLGNLGIKSAKIKLGLQLLDEAGRMTDFAGAKLVIHAAAPVIDRLLAQPPTLLEHRGEGAFHLVTPEHGFGHITFAPREIVPLQIAFTPPEHLDAFALRAIQYEETDGGLHLVGGQTFVFGKVAGVSEKIHP